MWTTRGLPIVQFLNEFVQAAREDGYEYVLLLVARPADDYLLYEKLFQDWTSIHHLTGTEIMFLFVGPGAASEKELPGLLARNRQREEELLFSPHVGVSLVKGRSTKSKHSSRMRNGYSYATLREHVASLREFDEIVQSHESQVKELRKRFSLTEAELPALVLLSLHEHREFPISIRGVVSLYGLLKFLVDEIEKCLAVKNSIREVNLALHRFRQASSYRFWVKHQQAVAALSDASPHKSNLLNDLKATLEEPFPWDNRDLKITKLKSILYAIKTDADAVWYYRKHRGTIQSIINSLQPSLHQDGPSPYALGPNGLKKLTDEQQDLKNVLSGLDSTILERALQNHLQEEYRGSTWSAGKRMEAPDVFISYSRADIEEAAFIEQYLRKNGYKVWRDEAVRAGYSFRAEIRTALLSAKSIVVLWTTNSIKSEWVEWEASMAHRRRCLIPLSDGTVSPHHLPAPFGNLQLLNVNEKDKLVARIQEIIAVG